MLLKIQAALLRYFVVVAVVVVVDVVTVVVDVVTVVVVVVVACDVVDVDVDVVVVVVVAAIVVAADPAPDAATLPPAHPSRHLPNLPALVVSAPAPSSPRVAAPLPLRHPKSGDTCCSSFRS